MLDKCEKCGQALPYWQEHAGAMKFFGDVAVKVCNPCHNDLSDAIMRAPFWPRVLRNDADRAFALASASSGADTRDEVRRLYEETLSLTLEAAAFVRGLIPAPQPAGDARE